MKFVGIKEGDPVLVMTVTLYYYGAVAGHTDDFIALNGCSVLPELNGLDVTFAGSVEARGMPSPMAPTLRQPRLWPLCLPPTCGLPLAAKRAVAPLQADPGSQHAASVAALWGPTEAGNALGVGCRAGITERAFTGPTAARVWALAMGGVTGPELREACFAAGLEVGGFLAACDTTEYKFRAGDTVGRWAQVIADQARLRQVSEIARGYLPLLLGWRLRYATLSRLSGAGSRGDLVPAADLARRFSERLRDQRGAVCSLGLPQADRLVGPFPRGRSLLFLRGRLSGSLSCCRMSSTTTWQPPGYLPTSTP